MKKVIKPAEQEESVYYSDFTGKCFGVFGPDITLSIAFDYGSKYDGQELKFHLTDKEAEEVLEFIKSKLSEDYKKTLKEKMQRNTICLDDSINHRDHSSANFYSNSCDLLKFLLN